MVAQPKEKMQLTALNLPADTDSKVLEYLDFFDIMNLSRVNRRLYYSTHRDESKLVQTDQNVKSIMHICSPQKKKNAMDTLQKLKQTQGSKIFGSNYHHNLVVQDWHLYDYKELRQMGDESSIVIQTYDYNELRQMGDEVSIVIQALKNDSFKFDRIESLGFSFRVDNPMIRNEPSSISLQNIFPCLLPNLLELDVTGVGANFEQLIMSCPLLKKVRMHYVQDSMKVSLYGTRMKTVGISRWSGDAWKSYSSFTCLRELYMDNGVFVCEDSHFFDLNNQHQKHIFTFFLFQFTDTRFSQKRFVSPME